jgi:hypothetical protein
LTNRPYEPHPPTSDPQHKSKLETHPSDQSNPSQPSLGDPALISAKKISPGCRPCTMAWSQVEYAKRIDLDARTNNHNTQNSPTRASTTSHPRIQSETNPKHPALGPWG